MGKSQIKIGIFLFPMMSECEKNCNKKLFEKWSKMGCRISRLLRNIES